MARERKFYVAYTYQTQAGYGQSIASSWVTMPADAKLTNDLVMEMRSVVAEQRDVAPTQLVITFFAELEA